MEITVLSSPPHSVGIQINDTRPKLEIGFGYVGSPFKTLVAGDNISLDTTETTITINAPTQPITRSVKTANYILALPDAYTMIDMNVAGDNTITVPPNSSVQFEVGTSILLSQYGAGVTEILQGSGVTVRSESGFLKLFAQYCGAVLIKIGTDEWYLQGALKA